MQQAYSYHTWSYSHTLFYIQLYPVAANSRKDARRLMQELQANKPVVVC